MNRFVEIKLDKTRNLRFGMVALMKIEKSLGKPFTTIDFDKLMYHELATIIWAGLSHEDASLTIDKVAELVDDYSNMQTVIAAMSEAMELSVSGGVKNEQGAAMNQQNGTGTQPLEMPSV